MGLNADLREYFNDVQYDFDKDEIKNVLEILDEEDEDLNGLSKVSKTLLIRLIDDTELIERVEEMYKEPDNDDPFI